MNLSWFISNSLLDQDLTVLIMCDHMSCFDVIGQVCVPCHVNFSKNNYGTGHITSTQVMSCRNVFNHNVTFYLFYLLLITEHVALKSTSYIKQHTYLIANRNNIYQSTKIRIINIIFMLL